MKPGIYTLPADTYHADPGDQPTLSSSIAKLLINASPLHAWTEHPRLNPAFARVEEDKFNVGNVAHAVLLEGRDNVGLVEANDWRTNEAKAMRDEIRASGRVPLLRKHYDDVMRMVDAVRRQLADLDVSPPPFTHGKPEQTVVWEDEGGVVCRVRPDWLHDSFAAADDLKTTAQSANPDLYERTLFQMGYDIQAAMYLRGIRAVTGADAEFRFVVVETSSPFAVSVHAILPAALELANDKVTYAIRKWRDCLESGRWPGYPARVCWHEAPGWAEAQWLEKEARESLEAA